MVFGHSSWLDGAKGGYASGMTTSPSVNSGSSSGSRVSLPAEGSLPAGELTGGEDPLHIAIAMDLVRGLSSATHPDEVLRVFAEGWSKLGKISSGYASLSCRGLEPGEYWITRFLLDAAWSDVAKSDAWLASQEKKICRGGLLGQIVETGMPVAINDLNVPDDPVLGDKLASVRSLMAIPLFEEGEIRNWSIQLSDKPDSFNDKSLRETLVRGNLVGGTVGHVKTAIALREANEKAQAEVQRIASIQRALLPGSLPQIPGLSLATSYETYDQAGGDFYFFHRGGTRSVTPDALPTGQWGIMIGDVSGHGPSAAVVMAMVESIVATYPSRPGSGVGDFLSYINQHLCTKQINGQFVTAFASSYNPDTRELTYARAGHPPPLLRRCDGEGGMTIDQLEGDGGLPLGVYEEETYETATVTLEPGHTLVLYTDGIPETRGPDGSFFGIDGINHALGHCSGQAHCAIDTIMSSVRKHEAGSRPQDDQTLVVFRVDEADTTSDEPSSG